MAIIYCVQVSGRSSLTDRGFRLIFYEAFSTKVRGVF